VTLGGDVSEAKSLAQSAMAKSSRLMNLFHDHEDKQTQDLIKAYALEHFEVGVYHSLSAYAGAIGDLETARLADTIREEERRAAERMEPFIPACRRGRRGQNAGSAAGKRPFSGGRKVLGVGLTPLLIGAGRRPRSGVYGVSRLRSGNGESDAGAQSGDGDAMGASAALTSQTDAATGDTPDVDSVIVTEEIIIVDLEDSAANRAPSEE
jgi:hypothetical protein